MNTSIRAAVITVSDTRRAQDDLSGRVVSEILSGHGVVVADTLIISDELAPLREKLIELSDSGAIDLLITSGGTGFGPRDNTPEATRDVIEREAPGMAEAMRRDTAHKTPLSMLSRAVCGIRNSVLIINLPGSPKGARECLEVILPVLGHAVSLLRGEKPH